MAALDFAGPAARFGAVLGCGLVFNGKVLDCGVLCTSEGVCDGVRSAIVAGLPPEGETPARGALCAKNCELELNRSSVSHFPTVVNSSSPAVEVDSIATTFHFG